MSPTRAPVLLTLLLLIVARPAGAAESPEDYDARITAELQATFPSAVPALARGNAAREADRNEEAIAAFEEVTRLAPDFTHGWRRLCQAETALERAEAVDHCKKALDLAELPENESALAGALLNIQGPEREAARARARYLATAAVEAAPDQLGGHLVLCRLAIEAQQQSELEACVKRLKGALPDAYAGYTFGAILALSHQDFDRAQAELTEARARGLPDDEADRLEALVADSRPLSSKLWSATKRYGPPWLIGLVVIIVLGSALSAATLASARRNAQVVDARVSGLDALLRKLYRGVLWACCAYYFVSLPVVLGVVLLTAGGLLYAIFAIGHIPIKLVLIIIVVAAMTIFAILKGLIATFRSGVDEDPGERLDLAQHPRLAATLKEVADKIGTRPVDSVYLEPDVSVAVLERGGMLKQLSGRTERCLVLGVAALDGLKVDEFKAILGHEYGHFKNEDTAGGGFGLAVRRSMMTMGVQLAISGAAAWWNPAWLFFRGFFWVFMRISQGATRLQEVLADRWAALAYGPEAFAGGLRHVVRRSVEFGAHVDASFRDVMENQLKVTNLYTYRPTQPMSAQDLETAVEEAWNRPASPLASHPSPVDRVAWVRALPAPAGLTAQATEVDAWSLLEDRAALEQHLSDTIRSNVLRSHGVDMHRPEPA